MVKSPLVMIVDDDPSVRKALGRLCRSIGYRVGLYESSEAFLSANAVESADLLILDVNLSGMSGLELQAKLAASQRRCPILFITACDDEPTREQAFAGGAIGFLGKPVDVNCVRESIEDALSAND